MAGRIGGGEPKAEVDAKASAEINVKWVVKCYVARMDETRNGLPAGQKQGRVGTGNKQTHLTFWIWAIVYTNYCFPVSQDSHFAVCLESMRTCGCKRETCRAKSLPNRWVSSGNHQGVSFNFHSHPSFTWVPVTRCKSFGRGISYSFDLFTRQYVWTCGNRLLLSRAPTSCSSYSAFSLGTYPMPPIYDLWPRCSFKAQANLMSH